MIIMARSLCPETAFVSDNQARYLKYPGKTSTRPNRGGGGTLEGNTNPENGGFQGTSKLLSPLQASQLLTDEYSAEILLATYKRKISAPEINQRYGIPIAACYRKIRILEEVGLIQCVERILTQKGKRKNLYTSCLRNAYIFFENGKLRARFQLATGQVKDFGGDWNGLDLMKQ